MKQLSSLISQISVLATAVSAVSLTTAHADILPDTSPFLRSASPAYSPEGLESSTGLVDPQFTPFSPGDSDLGVQEILTVRPDVTPVHVSLGVDLHYTDNAPATLFTTSDSSALLATRLGISWKPHLGNGWFADLGMSQEFYEFDENNALDFQNFLPYVGVVKNLVDLDDTIFYARYEYQRLTTSSFSESRYHASRVRTGLQKSLISTPRHQLSGGISAAYDLHAGPDALERKEYAVELSYSYSFTEKLSAVAIGRSAIWDFDDFGREDTVHTAGVELIYNFRENASVSTALYYTQNDSNSPFGANDSKAWQGGLTVGLNYSF